MLDRTAGPRPAVRDPRGLTRANVVAALIGIACFAAMALAGSFLLRLEMNRLAAHRNVELVSFGSLLEDRLARELSSVLYLTGGLKSYLVTRGERLNSSEVEAILATLYGDARHIRNFGVAVGYRLLYVYPVKGNEKVVGLNYAELPDQWPAVKRMVDAGVPVLLGPMELVQGGRGLIYRVPVMVRGKYWGLLSTVVDFDSLFAAVFQNTASREVDLAIRGKDGLGMRGEVFHGDPRLFEHKDAKLTHVALPGGEWVFALRSKSSSMDDTRVLALRFLVWALAAFAGWGAYTVLLQRARLARLALYDSLTGLPNRSLIEDRLNGAIAALRRNPSSILALMFVDLDGFKIINDRYGHRAGDLVLQGVAARAAHAVREVDSVGRWGGDELLVLLGNADRRQVPELIERVRSAVETPIEFAGRSLKVGASIGLAIVPDDGESAVDLIRLADHRMYENKQERKRLAGV